MTELRFAFPTGNQPRCRLEFRQDGVLAAPTSVIVSVSHPDATVQTLGLPDLQEVSTGVYDLFVYLDKEGDYLLKVKCLAPFYCATSRIRITATP